MVSRRGFLISLVMQPIVIGCILSKIPKNILSEFHLDTDSDFVIINGWVFLKSDLLKIES